MMSGLRSLLRKSFPDHCISCGESIVTGLQLLCEACRSSIEPIRDLSVAQCVSCSRPLLSLKPERCYQCHLHDLPPSSNSSLFSYQDVILKDLYQKFKFESSPRAGLDFCRIIGSELQDALKVRDWDILCPVPVSPRTRRTRGYNQVCFMLDELGIAYVPLMKRKNHSREQNKLGLRERELQIQGQFRIMNKHRECIPGRHILLIDDIYTTGSTVRECGRILLQAGAAGVQTLSFMRS